MIIQVKVKEVVQGEKGSAYSGNYGHAGIPGSVGGSAPTGGGSGSSNIRGSFEVLSRVSNSSHPLNALYRKGEEGSTVNFSVDPYGNDSGQLHIGEGKELGVYNFIRQDSGKYLVQGSTKRQKKDLKKEYPTVEEGIAAAENHYTTGSTVSPKHTKKSIGRLADSDIIVGEFGKRRMRNVER